MAQQTEQGATPEPGAADGQAHELTVIVPLKPGGADRTRAVLKQRTSDQARARRGRSLLA